MTATVLKNYFKEQNPKLIAYRKYKNHDYFLIFWEEFQSKLKDLLPNGKSLKGFQDYCLQIMIFYASLKTKYVRSNQVSFMHEELQRAIMIRSKLKNTFLKAELKVRKKIFETKKYLC